MINYSTLPEGLRSGMQLFVEEGRTPGSFLTAVLSNDLLGAVSYADSMNIKALPDIVRWVFYQVPSAAWGSRDKFQAWEGGK